MAGAAFTIDISGLKETREQFEDLGDAVDDLREAMEAGAAATQANVDLGFKVQSDPYGRKWASLAPLTQFLRRGSSYQILSDTGRLKNSISTQVDSGSFTVGTGLNAGTVVRYAATHQYGATILPLRYKFLWAGRPGGVRIPLKKAKIPARPFLPTQAAGMPDDWAGDIEDAVQAVIEASLS